MRDKITRWHSYTIDYNKLGPHANFKTMYALSMSTDGWLIDWSIVIWHHFSLQKYVTVKMIEIDEKFEHFTCW